jgi:hypothetical protein
LDYPAVHGNYNIKFILQISRIDLKTFAARDIKKAVISRFN